MEPTIEELRRNYEKFDNSKLIRLATEEASGLRPEALTLLKQIINERGLSEDIEDGIEAQLKGVDNDLFLEYVELIRVLPCPVCNSINAKLNATLTGTVISVIFFTNYDEVLKIACPDCLDRANDDAITKSGLLGWWSPKGIFKTPQTILFNRKMKSQNKITGPNDLLRVFVAERIGRIVANKNNQEGLREIIEHLR
jgi:hypothetical protein